MKTLILYFALFVLCLSFAPSVLAQSGPNPVVSGPDAKGIIYGTVTDKSSEIPLEYTSIAIYNKEDSSLVTGTVTNASGEFELEEIPYGSYYLEIKFVGYEKFVYEPVLLTKEERNLNLGQLHLSVSTSSIDEVEIVADQKRVEYRLDKKIVNVSQDLSSAGGSAVDVLENTPSVQVDIEGNVTLRGSGNFTVLINGKPSVLEGADALRQIPASTIRNIEIITNPSVKYDPDGTGGIINVILKKEVEPGTTGIINGSVGLNHKYRIDALVNRRAGKLNYFLGGSYDDNLFDGTLVRDQSTVMEDGTILANSATGDFDFIRGGAQVKAGADYNLSPRTNIAIEANGGTSKFGINRSNYQHEYTVPEVIDRYYFNTDIMSRNQKYMGGNLSLSQTFDTSAHKLVAILNFSHEKSQGTEDLEFQETDELFNPVTSLVPVKARNVESGSENEFRLQLDYTKPFSNGTLETGYQARIDDNNGKYTYEEYDPDLESWTSFDERSSAMLFFRNIQSAYAQYGGKINNFQLQAGLRGEYTYRLIEYENFNSSYLIKRMDLFPTLHLSREFKNDNQLMLSYSKRINRPRSFFLDSIPSYVDKQTIRIGNPSLEPEYVNSFELSYQKGWGKNFIAIEGYYRNTENLISRVTDFDDNSGIFYQKFENINEDHAAGTEMMLNWQIAKWVELNTGTDFFYYRIRGELYGETIDNSTFSWSANANTTFTIRPTSRIQANIGYYGPSVTAQGTSEGMYYINLAVRQDFFKRKLSATLQVRDLLGSMKREFTASGQDFNQYVMMQREPRVLMLSLSYRINNYRSDMRDRGQQSSGMEMDSGF